MLDSAEDKDKLVEAEIASLEQQIAELSSLHEGLYQSGQQIPIAGPKSQKRLDELYSKLNNARQAQLAHLLASISESTNRLEAATRSLQQSSDAQVRVAESQVKISESQVKVSGIQAQTIKKLLKSSLNLETFTLYLIVVALANIVVVIAQASGTKWTPIQLGVMAIVVFVALAAALVYSRIQEREAKKLDKSQP